MTNHYIDFKNADVILVMGSNPASNHPVSMKWILKAKEQGAKLIVVDPRFTQTATKADVYASLRSGTDIPFLGGMIKYILDNNLIFKEYVVKYTNASFLVNPDYKGPINGHFQEIVAKDGPGCIVYVQNFVCGVSNKVKGYVGNPLMFVDISTVTIG